MLGTLSPRNAKVRDEFAHVRGVIVGLTLEAVDPGSIQGAVTSKTLTKVESLLPCMALRNDGNCNDPLTCIHVRVQVVQSGSE